MDTNGLPYVVSYSPSNGLLEGVVAPSGGRFMPVSTTVMRSSYKALLQFDKKPTEHIEIFSNGKTIQLFYAARGQEVLFERVDTPFVDNDDHASWQIGRRIRVFVQSKQPTPFRDLKTVPAFNTSTQGSRLIENL